MVRETAGEVTLTQECLILPHAIDPVIKFLPLIKAYYGSNFNDGHVRKSLVLQLNSVFTYHTYVRRKTLLFSWKSKVKETRGGQKSENIFNAITQTVQSGSTSYLRSKRGEQKNPYVICGVKCHLRLTEVIVQKSCKHI